LFGQAAACCDGTLVSAGMTCTVVIKEGAAPEIGLGIKKVMAAIFGASSG
jgi:hypothetical protein